MSELFIHIAPCQSEILVPKCALHAYNVPKHCIYHFEHDKSRKTSKNIIKHQMAHCGTLWAHHMTHGVRLCCSRAALCPNLASFISRLKLTQESYQRLSKEKLYTLPYKLNPSQQHQRKI